MNKNKGNILITVLIVITVLISLALFFSKSLNPLIRLTSVLTDNDNLYSIEKSAFTDGLYRIKKNIHEFLKIREDIVYTKKLGSYYFTNLIKWETYPEIFTITVKISDNKPTETVFDKIDSIKQAKIYCLVNSPFIYDILCQENLEIKNFSVIDGAVKYNAEFSIDNTSKINGRIFFNKTGLTFPENGYISNNRFTVSFPELSLYKDLSTQTIENSFISNKSYRNEVIYRDGDLTANNCTFDSCTLIINGNLTIQGKSRVTPYPELLIRSNDAVVSFKNLNKLDRYVKNNTTPKYITLKAADSNISESFFPHPSIVCRNEVFINLVKNENWYIQGIISAKDRINIKQGHFINAKLSGNDIVLSNSVFSKNF